MRGGISINTKWKHEKAAKELDNLSGFLGVPPILSIEEEGIAIWTAKALDGKNILGYVQENGNRTNYGENCFNEIIIRDEDVTHLCPAKHSDFLYSYIHIPIDPPKKLTSVLSLSGSVGYDGLKQMLYARCGSIEANIATLKIATDLLIGKEAMVKIPRTKETNEKILKYHTIDDVHEHDVYGTMIKATWDGTYTKEIYKSLCDNIKKLVRSDKMDLGYWPAAFSVKGDKCYKPDETLLEKFDIEHEMKSIIGIH